MLEFAKNEHLIHGPTRKTSILVKGRIIPGRPGLTPYLHTYLLNNLGTIYSNSLLLNCFMCEREITISTTLSCSEDQNESMFMKAL